ncbi:MAG: hypothetical protein HY711_07995, partial [Candidatus Melainabacteria bacterium]|nr:hypothetical protein [Candidatus Melainabacteria bacterium]
MKPTEGLYMDVSAQTMIPDLLREHPTVRPVLDRYGLKGCGGAYGPVESIAYFARAHDVDPSKLVAELNEAIAQSTCCNHDVEMLGKQAKPDVVDTIYRRFFITGIAVVLTFGATWGAWLLWRIGFNGAFSSVPMMEINAHAQAQIFGWVGMFIMGFAYQAFPRFWHSELVSPKCAVAAFVLMLSGVIASTIGIALQGHSSHALSIATAGGAAEVVASVIFAGQMVVTLRYSGVRIEPYMGFILVALGWFVASALASAWHTWNTMTAQTSEQLNFYVHTFQGPLRDIQIHGLAMTMILGVSLRTLPHLFG